ncbi:two-component system histidine kinase PnpS [Radiobacillus sp. PE A8.2]|uniref:two-component system histidine kinase PnpS n=1 Tax=Radiobacillus sp. PE A8.2 TaxID=3380349 RepID=UPI0038910B4B
MVGSNSRTFLTYLIITTVVMVCIGVILVPLTENNERIIVVVTLLGGLIILYVLLFNIYEKYIKPVRSAAQVANELVKGNYKARTYVANYGEAGMLSNSVNVLARSLQEMTIQEKMQASQLRTVIDNMESGLMLIDERGYVHLVNRKFLALFGKEPKLTIGYLYYDVIDQVQIHRAVQEAFLYEEKVKDSFTISMEIEQKFIEVVGAPIFSEFKDLKGVVLVFHDITELKRVEEMRKDFVANVSHELKTPITSIRGFAETLLEDESDDAEIRAQFLSIILEESKRLQALVYDLLELSKLEKDELRLRYQKLSIDTLLDSILPIMEQQAAMKSIIFKTEINHQIIFECDPERLKQVFVNLLNNAINYTPANGEVSLTVQELPENKIGITVRDTGIGIPEVSIARIFERFYRVDKARSRNTGGTGLGLAIVKHIVEAHKGTITVESKVDQGSTFRIVLPKQ